jgi:heme/copper-type cytochrome/quinol oxidase subunit 3
MERIAGDRQRVVQFRRNALSNEVLGVALLIVSEATLFAGLIASLVILRSQFSMWPPMGQPRLPIEATLVNTVVLLASGAAMGSAVKAGGRRDQAALTRRLQLAALLGALFLGVQGIEWARMIGFGLTTSSHVYGALFYTIVGTHAAHVVAALGLLAYTTSRAKRGAYATGALGPLNAMALYWAFVVGVWPFLYVAVYLW